MLVISRGPEHQDLSPRVLRCRRPFQVSLLREACLAQTRDVSAVCTIKEAKWKPIHRSLGGGILEVRDISGGTDASSSLDWGCSVEVFPSRPQVAR